MRRRCSGKASTIVDVVRVMVDCHLAFVDHDLKESGIVSLHPSLHVKETLRAEIGDALSVRGRDIDSHDPAAPLQWRDRCRKQESSIREFLCHNASLRKMS